MHVTAPTLVCFLKDVQLSRHTQFPEEYVFSYRQDRAAGAGASATQEHSTTASSGRFGSACHKLCVYAKSRGA
jgi:hypothetical protein